MQYRKATDRDVATRVRVLLRELRQIATPAKERRFQVAFAAITDLDEMIFRGIPTSDLWDLGPGQVETYAFGPDGSWVPCEVKEKFVSFVGGPLGKRVPVRVVYDHDSMLLVACDVRSHCQRMGYVNALECSQADFDREKR